jgi:DNA-binding XRE family transcriptional regulator
MTSAVPPLSPLDQRWIKVLTHDLRVAILRHMLTVDTTTSKALASILGQPIGTVSYHVRRLRDAGQITLVSEVPCRGAISHHYRLSNRDATADALDRMGLAAIVTRSRPLTPTEKLARAAAELRRRREAQGLSRVTLATRVGIEPDHLADIERGEADPRFTTLSAIAQHLGTNLGDVFTLAER